MRLLTYSSDGRLCVTRDVPDGDVEPYAILSHAWGRDEDEVTFHEVGLVSSQTKVGYTKIEFCGQQACRDGLRHFWVDTCCIDKANHTELSRAITSMYRWYQRAQVCYVYLADVSLGSSSSHSPNHDWESSFRQSRWFTRGWTLQELLAPRKLIFYSREWRYIGSKDELQELLHDITGIPTSALDGLPLSQFPVIERMRWTRGRQTKEKEDEAYCLLGIFSVYMYLNYGEGDNAFRRLQREIDVHSSSDGVMKAHSDIMIRRCDARSAGLCINFTPHHSPNLFIGRTAEIERIHNILWSRNAPLEQRRVVLGGIGGIGKTQIAVAYVRQYRESYASVLWLNASSEQTLHADLRSVAEQLFLTSDPERLNQEQILKQLRTWLSSPENTQWLLIFDNYDDPKQLNMNSFCPRTNHGSIIIITRLPDEVDGELVRVRPLTEINDSLDILQGRSKRDGVRDNLDAQALVKRLAGLPVALVTAGAYLCNNDVTFREYLHAYEQRWQIGHRQAPLRDYQDRTLYTTWNLTYSRLETEDAEAARMLRLLAYFDSQEVWYELFRAGLSGGHPPSWLPAALSDRIDFGDVMGVLVKYCLVDIHHITQSYSMYSIHSCVHDWTLGALNREIDTRLYCYAFKCSAASVSRIDRDTLGQVRCARLSRHAVRLTHHRFQPHHQLSFGASEHLDEALWIAQMLQQQVQLSAAEQIYVHALAGQESVLGADHTSTLRTVYDLGELYRRQGKLAKAEQMFTRALVGQEAALGVDNPMTLDTSYALGDIYTDQGRLEEAEQVLEQVFLRQEQALGTEHTLTLRTTYALGLLYSEQHELVKAEQAYTQALAGYEKALGADHKWTLDTLQGIGNLYVLQDRLTEAEQMYRRALAGYEKAFGSEHMSTLVLLGNLSTLLCTRGKLDEADQMCEQALIGTEQALGANHDLTLSLVENRAVLYTKQGRQLEAERAYRRALAGLEKSSGLDHPATQRVARKLTRLTEGTIDEDH